MSVLVCYKAGDRVRIVCDPLHDPLHDHPPGTRGEVTQVRDDRHEVLVFIDGTPDWYHYSEIEPLDAVSRLGELA